MCNYKSLWFHYDTSTSPKGKKGLPLNHWRMGINPTPYIGFLHRIIPPRTCSGLRREDGDKFHPYIGLLHRIINLTPTLGSFTGL